MTTLRYIFKYTESSLKMLQAIGMWAWPGGSGWRRRLFITYTAIIYFSIAYIFCNNVAFTMIKLTDLNFLITESWGLFISISVNLRMIIFLMRNDDLTYIINKFPIIDLPKNILCLNKYKGIASNHSIISAIVLVIYHALFAFIYQAIFTSKEISHLSEVSLVLELVPFFITNEYIKSIVKFYHGSTIVMVLIFRVAFSTLFIHLLCYIQALLINLIESVKHVKIRDVRMPHHGTWPSTDDPTVIDIKYCVDQHLLIIRLVHKVNSVFSLQIMLLAFFSMLQLCFFAAAESSSEVETLSMTQFLSRATMLTAVMYELLIFSWFADGIKDTSSKLQETCLSMLWKSDDGIVGDWKSLEVMAARCETKLELRAGPFYCLSIKTLAKIVTMAFSYYVFLVRIKIH